MNRRNFIQTTAAMGTGLMTRPLWATNGLTTPFPVRRITQTKHYHWFGYYDKFQTDPTGRFAVGCEVQFEHRSPTAEDVLKIVLIDLKKPQRPQYIGTSRAWSWQQGCMLQWIPGSNSQIIWNDREQDRFVSRVYDMNTRKTRTLPQAIYTVSPDGTFAIGTPFNRIQNLRPGYGYAGIPDPYEQEKAPDAIGIYKMDLKTGDCHNILSIAQLAAIPHQGNSISDNWHWFNHLLVSPDNQRFLFLHRWRAKKEERQVMARTGFVTRMITADVSGKDCYILDPSGYTSHFVWRNPQAVCAWTQPVGKAPGFYLLQDKSQAVELIGKDQMTDNGHNTYVPDTNNEWILNDTYALGMARLQTLYLYHVPSDRKVVLGTFYSPTSYVGEWRCDLHPRCNRQGTKVYFDSTHEGKGRQMYEIDIAQIVK
jgi:hypothetical protein